MMPLPRLHNFSAPVSINPEAGTFLEQNTDLAMFLKRSSGQKGWSRTGEVLKPIREVEAKTLMPVSSLAEHKSNGQSLKGRTVAVMLCGRNISCGKLKQAFPAGKVA